MTLSEIYNIETTTYHRNTGILHAYVTLKYDIFNLVNHYEDLRITYKDNTDSDKYIHALLLLQDKVRTKKLKLTELRKIIDKYGIDLSFLSSN